MSFKQNAPGLSLSLFIAVIAILISQLPFPPFTINAAVRHPIEPLIVAIIIGIVLANCWTLPNKFTQGITIAKKHLLPTAIVLMGARLNFQDLLSVSGRSLFINIFCVLMALVAGFFMMRFFKIGKKLGMLIVIGTAICGSSAIVACAPIIAATEADISLSVASINLFGIIAIFAFPLMGELLHLSMMKLGVWSGISIQAVPQVLAASFAYGATAGKIATIVKLTRVLMLAPIMVALGVMTNKSKTSNSGKKSSWTTYMPPMILGFIIMIILNSAGLFSTRALGGVTLHPSTWMTELSNFLVIMTMVGIGLSTKFKDLLQGGVKALSLAFVGMLFLIILSLFLIHLFL